MPFQLRIQTIVRPALLINLLVLAFIVSEIPATPHGVALVSFTAASPTGQPDIYVEWETATQYGTVGFFIARSNSAQGPYVRVSEFIPRYGDDLTGWQYDWTDETTELGHTYYYHLEEITVDQDLIIYGPVVATAGSPIPLLPFRVCLPLVGRSN